LVTSLSDLTFELDDFEGVENVDFDGGEGETSPLLLKNDGYAGTLASRMAGRRRKSRALCVIIGIPRAGGDNPWSMNTSKNVF